MPEVSIFKLILSYLINKKPFRLSKNGQPMNIFHKIEGGGNNQGGAPQQIQNASGNQNTIKIELNRGNAIKKKGLEPRMMYDDPK